jgi:uncharacterized surface protein with fasciclin (FAS1) repeats
MNSITFRRFLKGSLLLFLLVSFSSLFFTQCTQDPQYWKVASTDQVAGDYIATHAEYSEFEKLVQMTGMDALLRIRGPYTLFLPNNDAMLAFYKEKNVSSLEGFSQEYLTSLIRNHVITNEINTSEFGLGALRDTNAIGDYLVTEFDGSDIVIEKHSKLIKRNIRTANGYIHIIDKVIEPVTADVFTVISSDPSYKIFAEGLELSGLKDTLQLIKFPFGKKSARTRFTVLAVPDTIFNRYGINNVNDLVNYLGANPDSVTYLNNPFYRYMEYHCLNGTHYLNTLKTTLYPILSSDNNVSMTIDTDYKINLVRKTQKYTSFIIPSSNVPAKNGAVHAINGLLTVTQPEPVSIMFETTDFFDFKQGEYYKKHYEKFSDGENGFANIHWQGDYMQYHFKKAGTGGTLINDDCLQIIGWFTLSVTFPKLMKGKWEVRVYQPNWGDVTSCKVYIDGQLTGTDYLGARTGGPGGLQKVGEVDFKTTAAHTVTLVNYAYGMIFWDYIQFDPIR